MKKFVMLDQNMKADVQQVSEKLDFMMFIAYYVEENIDQFDETKDADSAILQPWFMKKSAQNWMNGTVFSNCYGSDLKNYGLSYKTSMVQGTWTTAKLQGADQATKCDMNNHENATNYLSVLRSYQA